jgi:hypothetical protein
MVSAMEPRRGSWLEQRTKVMVEELDLLGLSAPEAELAQMIKKTLVEVAAVAGISEVSARRYVDDERLRSLAQEIALKLAEERPGAALLDQPRTIPLALPVLGRVVMALAEATRIRVVNGDEAGADQTLELLSFLGHVLHDAPHGSGPLGLPQAALARAARQLETTAKVIEAGGAVPAGLQIGDRRSLATALLADALSLRTLLSDYGTDAGPTLDS